MTATAKSLRAFTVLIALCAITGTASADAIKDTLDRAKMGSEGLKDKAKQDLLDTFDTQIRIIRQTGDIDAVESLTAERKAFVDSQTLPDKPSLKPDVLKYQRTMDASESVLKEAYETAIADYTKTGRDDDAALTKRLMNERFAPVPTAPPKTSAVAVAPQDVTPNDPILTDLQQAKHDFVQTVKDAQANLLKAIQAKANAAADAGDLDGYKQYTQIYNTVGTELLLPDDVKDTALQNENAKFLHSAGDAYTKLHMAYQTAVSGYTKARKIPEAEAIQHEMKEGGWFSAYTGTPPAPKEIDMLKAIDIEKNTIRRGWRVDNGVLEPTGWDDDHGPWMEIPVMSTGSYELHLKFTLANVPEAIYMHVPIGQTSAVLMFAAHEQTFGNIAGRQDLRSQKNIPLSKINDAQFRVTLTGESDVRVELILNGESAIVWKGTIDQVRHATSVWTTTVESYFGIGSKSGSIIQMELKKNR